MVKNQVTPLNLQQQAQQGDLGAIAQLLEHITTAAHARVQVCLRGHILEVYLIDAHRGSLEGCALMVYSAVYALGMGGVQQLMVLEGPPQENHQQWQQTFTLTSAGPLSPKESSSTAPSSTINPAVSPAGDSSGLAPTETPVAVAEGEVISPPPAALGQKGLGRSLRGNQRWLRWVAVVGCSFFLGAGLAQWQYDRRQTESNLAVDADSPPAKVFPTDSQDILPLGSGAPSAENGAEAWPASATMTPLGQTLAQASPDLESMPLVTIKAVGDMIMGTNYPRTRMPEDWQYFFDAIKFHLGEADLVFGNFESTLTEVPRSSKNISRPMTYAFRSPPWYASVLRAAGFDVLNVANNHSMDFFEQGFNDTVANIESEGMIAVGRKGDIQYTEVNGVTVAFIGFSYLKAHNSVHDLDAAGSLVQEAEQNADVVIISVHAGKEGTDAVFSRNQEEFFYSENRGNLVHFSRTVVDYGADLVLGHGPHVPRAVELYSDRLIAYSLGNFLGYRTLSHQGPLGLSMILQIRLDGDGKFVDGRIIPAALDPNGVPYLDNHFGSVISVRNATRRDFPDTPLTIDDVGQIVRRD